MSRIIALGIFALTAMFAESGYAQVPTKAQVLALKGSSWEGTLKQKDGGPDWYCKITLQDEGKVYVKWAENDSNYTGKMSDPQNNPKQHVAMNAVEKRDGSVVRFQWNSLDAVDVRWWPSAEAQAGQKEHKPPHVFGTVKLLK